MASLGRIESRRGERGPQVVDVLRIAFAALTAVALTYQYASLDGRSTFVPVNFFSFFTVESNILAAVVLVLTALSGPDRSLGLEIARAAAALYMAITGVVFAILLAGLQEELQTTIPWVDFVVHRLMPVVVVVDWFVDPPRRRLPRRFALLALIYPVAYGAYCLIRGPHADWYPYPFLDAGTIGYDGVLLRGAFLLAGMAAGAAAVVFIGNHLRRG